MLAHRVIPVVLCRGRTLVKGQKFDSWRSVGVAAQAVRIHQARGVDELVLLDIGATPEGRGPDLDLVRELSEVCFMPLAVGGGIGTIAEMRELMRAGADKVVICSAAVDDTDLIQRAADTFGSQALVVAIDVYDRVVCTHCALRTTGWEPEAWAQKVEHYGAGEIFLTSIPREGTMSGYDIGLIETVARPLRIPVIANGGCSGPDDMLAAIRAGASACAAGALFQFSDVTPRDCARFLAEQGVEARA